MTQTPKCSRCGHFLARPLPQNGNYVTADDFIDEEEEVYHVGLKHTDATKKRVENLMRIFPGASFGELSAAVAHPEASETIEYTYGEKWVEQKGGRTKTAAKYEHPFSVPRGKFHKVELDSPQEVHRKDIARVEEHTRPVKVQRTGLICPDCLKDDDEIIWGVDK